MPTSKRTRLVLLAATLCAGALWAGYHAFFRGGGEDPSGARLAGENRVKEFCAACHKLPSPDILPREVWESRVKAMCAMVGQTKDNTQAVPPPVEEAVSYYTSRAPEALPPSISTVGNGPGSLRVDRVPLKLNGLPHFPGTANLHFVHLYDDLRFDLLICEMRFGMVLVMQPYLSFDKIGLIARVPHPCHAEVVDLDRDGRRDILVANLGTVTPSDVTEGSIVWLRGTEGGAFESIPLARELGRVADVQAADFDGDGDLDVVSAVFGWRRVGEILYLENQTKDYASPELVPYTVDPRPGAIHVPVADLNGDGRPDFVALISQHFEAVVAFLNRGGGRFEPNEIFSADHPNWGSSGIELVDLDLDGDLDVLLANGDTLDDLVLKPYHGIEWLENEGKYPFTYHRLTSLYGVHRAKAADLDLDGDLDIAACVFLPFVNKETPGIELADSIIWLEQTSRGVFERHPLEASMCKHPTLDAADYDRDGDVDIAVGNMTMAKGPQDTIDDWVILLQNRAK